MKRRNGVSAGVQWLVLGGLVAASAYAQSVGIREVALARLALAHKIAADTEVLKAIRAKNAVGESLDEIQRKDKEWTANPQYPLRKTMTSSPCGQRLREMTQPDATVVEVIVMDRNGANVCVSRETSDYWQGDEAKFEKTFGAGKELFVDEPAFDASSGVYAIQMSALIYDGGAKVGALTLGLRVRKDQVQRQ